MTIRLVKSMSTAILIKFKRFPLEQLAILSAVIIAITLFSMSFPRLRLGFRMILNQNSSLSSKLLSDNSAKLFSKNCINCTCSNKSLNLTWKTISYTNSSEGKCRRNKTSAIKCWNHQQWEGYDQHCIDLQAYQKISFGYQKSFIFVKGGIPIFTYSAFYDPRFDSGPVILINGFNYHHRPRTSKCLFFTDAQNIDDVKLPQNTTHSDLIFIGESIAGPQHYHCAPPDLGLAAIGGVKSCIIVCPFPNIELMPSHISLDDVSGNKMSIESFSKSNTMPVIFPEGVFDFESNPNFKTKYEIVTCGAIVYFDYDAVTLIEWFELTQILAAEHVFLCTIQSAPNVNKILKYYILQGFLDVVEWDTIVPTGSVGHFQTLVPACEIHCSQLYQYQSKFIAHYDLDQFIIPRIWGNTFPEFLRNYEVEHERKYGSPFGEIVFRNRYLFTNLQKALAEECEPKYLVTQRFRYKWSSDYNLDQIKTIIRSPWCILKYQHGCTSSFEKYRYTSNCSIGQGSNNKESKCSRNEAISRMSKLFNSSAILLDHELGGVLHYKGCHWRPYQNCILAEEKGVYDDSMELYRNCLIANVHDAIARMQLVAVTFPTLG